MGGSWLHSILANRNRIAYSHSRRQVDNPKQRGSGEHVGTWSDKSEEEEERADEALRRGASERVLVVLHQC